MKRVLGARITVWIAALLFLSLNCPVAAEPHNLVENFTARLNSSDQIHSSVVTTDPWRGVGHAHLTYKAEGRHRKASLFLPDEKYRIPGPGTVKMWVKGDGSGNNLRICVRHARVQHDQHGRRRLQHHKDIWSRQVKLDFAGWKRLSFDMSEIPDDRSAWWRCLEIKVPRGQEAKMSGKLALDEFVQIPKKSRPKGAVAVTLIGPRIRNFSRKIAVSLDVRNFTRKSQEIKARLVATDRNENLVLDRDFTIKAEPFARISADENKTSEHHLQLMPDQIAQFLPPFKVQCDVGSELTDLSVSRSFKVVMGNSIYLFDDLSDVYGRWFTAGGGGLKSMRHWPKWIMGEQQRYSPFYQTSARLTRVPVEHKPTGKLLAERYLGKYAMKFDYWGNAAVYMTRRRYLPGNAYRMGVWVKGDGNGAELWARFLDYTDNADFWPGGWKRIGRGGRLVCRLDFTDWRYFEVELPGGGIGRNTPRGSTDALDFPLELTAFRIEPGKEKTSGSVQIGAIHVHTQQPQRKTLAVQVGYEDAERRWGSEGDAWAAVQNSWPGGGRKVRVTWNLLDRKNEEIASGQKELGLNPVATANVEIPLSKFAAKIEKCLAPFRLQVVATDTEDFSTSTTRELIIARPDSSALVADFEAERGYLGMLPRGMERKKPAGEYVAWTSAKVSHGGQRSLAINWKKEAGLQLPVSVDPPLPGVPVELSLWVNGDGKGEIMYPLIGDKRGVSHGAHGGQWDLFLPRTSAGKFQNVVKVDWKGWKKLTFNLPVIPPTWQEKLPVLGFEASYPLGVHLMVDGRDASAETGTIYIDDLRAETHLAPQHRVNMRLRPMGKTNVLGLGEAARVLVTNHGMA
ncbi:MAG: hypothetical protein KGZ25_13815, partial [Planctomycetes bacterium]|nr:hypothetical protein [Planctomycetota bacterium]